MNPMHQCVRWIAFATSLASFGAGSAARGQDSSTATKTSLVVATWNICHGRGSMDQPVPASNPKKRDQRLNDIASILRNAKADIVVLNECSFESTVVGGPNQAQWLADQLGLPFVSTQLSGNLSALGITHRWGNAILSRFTILDSEMIELPSTDSVESWLRLKRKDALRSCLELPNGMKIQVIALHLPVGPDSISLQRKAAERMDWYKSKCNDPVLLCGDFNASLGTNAEPTCVDWLLGRGYWHTDPARELQPKHFTFPSEKPDRAIDWVLVPKSWRILSRESPPSSASDHLSVICVVEPN
jgi:endonuclease/exonuclease/phosphatase family metal-dependent hydrolase